MSHSGIADKDTTYNELVFEAEYLIESVSACQLRLLEIGRELLRRIENDRNSEDMFSTWPVNP